MGDAAYAVPALDEADVPIKTIQGLKALRYAERSFTMNMRTLAVLRLADGKRTTSEIRRLDSGRGDAAEILAYLHAIGLLQLASTAPQIQPLADVAHIDPSAGTSLAPPGYIVEAEAQVAAVKHLLVHWAVKALGPDGSVRLALQVERTKSRDELLAVLERMCAMFTGGMSKEAIETHRADALRLLGLAPARMSVQT